LHNFDRPLDQDDQVIAGVAGREQHLTNRGRFNGPALPQGCQLVVAEPRTHEPAARRAIGQSAMLPR
jgi:hypothetical protein